MSDSESKSRRIFLKQVTGASGSLGIGAALSFLPTNTALASDATPAPESSAAAIGSAAPAAPAGYTSLSGDEAAFVEAMVNVMCPADALTPSGVDCGLATYIDRQLAGAFGRGDRLYRQGPVREGKPQHGYQLPLTPEE